MSYSTTFTKSVREMSTADIKKKAIADGLAYYKQQWEANPEDPNVRAAYEQYCQQNGFSADEDRDRLAKMSMEDLRNEWEAQGKAVEAAELETYRDKNAKIWVASQTRYEATPENADKIIAMLETHGMKGSVADFNLCFDMLCESGEIQAPTEPVQLLSRAEMNQLSLPELRAYLERIGA